MKKIFKKTLFTLVLCSNLSFGATTSEDIEKLINSNQTQNLYPIAGRQRISSKWIVYCGSDLK